MSEHDTKEDILRLMNALGTSPTLTQRDLSLRLNISLGKTNYLLRQVLRQGLIKVNRFSHSNGKLSKVSYILTRRGAREQVSLTAHFLRRKEVEYTKMKEEWERLRTTGRAHV